MEPATAGAAPVAKEGDRMGRRMTGHPAIKFKFLVMAGCQEFTSWLGEDDTLVKYLLNKERLLYFMELFGFANLLQLAGNFRSAEIFTFCHEHQVFTAQNTSNKQTGILNGPCRGVARTNVEYLRALSGCGDSKTARCLVTVQQDARKDIFKWAVENGIGRVCQAIIGQGIDVNMEYPNGVSPVYVATMRGHANVVNILVKAGANLSARTTSHNNHVLMYVAASKGHKKVVQILIAAGACVDASVCQNTTPLYVASGFGHEDVVRQLLNAGGNANSKSTSNQTTPLHIASLNGHAPVVDLLIQKGAKVDSGTTNVNNTNLPFGVRPLHNAAQNGHLPVVELLITAQANVNATTDLNVVPLHLAAENGHEDVVVKLLASGASHNAKSLEFYGMKAGSCTQRHMDTPLLFAARNGHVGVMRKLLEHGADKDVRNGENNSPIFLAAENGHAKAVKYLIEQGADINRKNSYNASPLAAGSENGHRAVVEILVASGARVLN